MLLVHACHFFPRDDTVAPLLFVRQSAPSVQSAERPVQRGVFPAHAHYRTLATINKHRAAPASVRLPGKGGEGGECESRRGASFNRVDEKPDSVSQTQERREAGSTKGEPAGEERTGKDLRRDSINNN